MAKADIKEMIILPTAMPVAITPELNSILATGTLMPANNARP